MVYIRTISNTKEAKVTNKQVVGKRISRTSIKIIFSRVLWSIQWPCQQVQCFMKTHAGWSYSYLLDTGRTSVSFFFSITLTMSTRRVRPIGMRCLLLFLCSFSYLYLIRGPCCSALNVYFFIWIFKMVRSSFLSISIILYY